MQVQQQNWRAPRSIPQWRAQVRLRFCKPDPFSKRRVPLSSSPLHNPRAIITFCFAPSPAGALHSWIGPLKEPKDGRGCGAGIAKYSTESQHCDARLVPTASP
eukprot:3545727-Alexandrium_andersonii.AAC.1